MKPLKNCPKCHGKGYWYLPATYPPRRTADSQVTCECTKRITETQRIGKMAALEDLLSTCENDIGHFFRDDLTPAQNQAMQAALVDLQKELTQRRDALKPKATRTGMSDDLRERAEWISHEA